MEITSRKNETVRRFRELARDKKLRDSEGTFVIEGDHLCTEAVSAGFEIVAALITQSAARRYASASQLERCAKSCMVISDDIAEYISDTKSPQGLFAQLKRKPVPTVAGNRLVILDGVQDPGNVGTIIRTAEALGINGVLLSEGCADIWSPKVLRASMGSVFRMPCISGQLPLMITSLKEQGFSVYGAMLDETAQRLGEIEFPEKAAAVIGSEGSGISQEVRNVCTGGLYIPISGAESLNAAAAASIILWELSGRG